MRVIGSRPFKLRLTYLCLRVYVRVCECVCACVPLSVRCPCSILVCFHVFIRSFCILPPCTPVCLCCYCVCWLQFTQIWPYCRQVSLLWKVLQWDPGQQCDPGRRPGTATDVSSQARLAELFMVIIVWDDQSVSSLDFHWKEPSWTQSSLFVSFMQQDIERSVWKEEKRHVGLWAVSTACPRLLIWWQWCFFFPIFKEHTDEANVCRCRFIECKDCGRKMHQICVLHHEIIWPSGWVSVWLLNDCSAIWAHTVRVSYYISLFSGVNVWWH